MKILFIYSLDDVQSVKTPLRSWESVQLGISYISSVLKQNGHQTRLLVLGSNHLRAGEKMLRSAIEAFEPSVVCLTSIQSQFVFIKKIARLVKFNWPGIYVVVGGAYPTLCPAEAITGSFDALCVGEGEYPVLELCDQLEKGEAPHKIQNLWIKTATGRIEKNKTRDFLARIDDLPFPDREMWKPWIKEQSIDEFAVLLARGCPFECAYCSNHAFRKVAGGNYVRLRSVDSIIKEIAHIHAYHPLSRMYFEVESIALDKSWMFELCKALEEFNKTLTQEVTYGCNFRITPETMDEAIFIALARANFRRINIGLESGNQRIRDMVLKRRYSNEDFLNVVSMARKHGLKVLVYNMVGMPGETPADHQDTILVNRQCQPDKHYTQVFYPYKGTELYDLCLQKGYIRSELGIRIERRESVINMPQFTKPEIMKSYYWFDYYVYKDHKPLWKILIMVLMVKLQANPVSNLMFRRLLQFELFRRMRVRLMGVYNYNT